MGEETKIEITKNQSPPTFFDINTLVFSKCSLQYLEKIFVTMF